MPPFQINKPKDCTHCLLERKKKKITQCQVNSASESQKRQEDAMARWGFKYTLRLMELIEHRWGQNTDKDWHSGGESVQVKQLETIRAGEETSGTESVR